MQVAISPCPNDTFLFHAWSHGLLNSKIIPQITFGDIQQLNEWALQRSFPLIKISIGILDQLIDDYFLLPVGTALGMNCGPKIISKKPFPIEELPNKRIAIPGKNTTAHLLLERLTPSSEKKVFCLYNEIFSLIDQGKVDCGLIIHESRFTYEKAGFCQIADLGILWHKSFNLPLPLGGIVAKKNLTNPDQIVTSLQQSLIHAWNSPTLSKDFILQQSQEKDEVITCSHISTYVTCETLSLSERGICAIEFLINKDRKLWLYS